jgi:crotonobetainyl-CoA:carnitine CoA-transferase CaiB-like acyl-CoA transferase
MTDDHSKHSNGPFLAGTRIIDLAEGEAAFCSKLLADLGATVVKVELPSGDPTRRRDEVAFLYHNTNKLGVTVDPATPEGRSRLRILLERADVLIETSSEERAATLGITPAQTLGANPALVHLSITGFGKSGPKAASRWCDEVISASGGQAYLTGSRSGPPLPLFQGQALYASSLFGAVAILLALRNRSLTGKGLHIDLSAQEAVASTLDHVMVDYFRNGTVCARRGNIYGEGSFAILPASDGHVLLGLSTGWETVAELAATEGGASELTSIEWQDEGFRAAHLDRVLASLEGWTRLHPKEELFTIGQAMRFAWAPVCSPDEAIKSPQLSARRFFVPVSLPREDKTVPAPGLPYRFRHFSPPLPRPVPALGEHNAFVFESPPASRHDPERTEGDRRKETALPVLEGLRVLDFTWMLAGPYVTRIFADFGAEVIKVQSVRAARAGLVSDPVYDATWNRNKRSIALDLDRPGAREIVSGLLSEADIVVENFSPRVMEGWGLSYEELKQIKPGIIMASISATGHSGPWKEYIGFGPTFHALSGLVSEVSARAGAPVCPGHAYADTVIALYGTLAILAALERKRMTGQGEYIDLSGYEALCTLLGPAFISAGTGKPDEPGHGQDRPGRHVGWYPCRGEDRWCVIAFEGEDDWERFAAVAGLTGPSPERSPLSQAKETKWQERDIAAASWTADRTPGAVASLLQRNGIAAGAVQDARDLARDPQLAFRRFFVSLDHPTLGTLRSDRSALFLEEMARAAWKSAPLPGEDTVCVLGGMLGLSEEKIRKYFAEGVIA